MLGRLVNFIVSYPFHRIRLRLAAGCALALLGAGLVDGANGKAQAAPSIALSADERAWLSEHAEIRLAIDIDWAPIEYIDKHNQYRGMVAEYIRLVEESIGINLKINKVLPWSKMVKAVEEHELDVFSAVMETPQRKKFLNFTKPFLSFPIVIITLDNEPYVDGVNSLKGKAVSVVDSYATHELMARNYPELLIKPVPNVRTGLEAVSTGQVYAFIGNLAAATHMIRQAGITNIKIAGQADIRMEIKMAVRKDWPELVPILQKALDAIPETKRNEIYNEWVRFRYEKEVDYKIILALLGIGVLIVAIILAWNRRLYVEIRRRRKVERALDKERQRLEYLAHFDPLTELPNRVLFSEWLNKNMIQSHLLNKKLAVCYVDLDGFKSINDLHGHSMGDVLLVEIAGRMKKALRESDTLARLGGDEFVAVLTDLRDRQDSIPVIENLLAAVADQTSVLGVSSKMTASIGVTFYPQEHEIDPEQLVRQADQAMYTAKLKGKNNWKVFDAEKDKSLKSMHEKQMRARQGLEQDEFLLYYQPKVNMKLGQVVGAEALIRWRHPEWGLIKPGEFQWALEDPTFTTELGELVIDRALRQIRQWQTHGLEVPISVNISPIHLRQRDFIDFLEDRLSHRYRDVNPKLLELEVLETSVIYSLDPLIKNMWACRALGVTFALDDFGAGYSSFTHLKELPINMIKIDQNFIQNMLSNLSDWKIVRGILGLAKAFNIPTIGEGVESTDQGQLLLQHGCEIAQGYVFAAPMPAEDWIEWMRTWEMESDWIQTAPRQSPKTAKSKQVLKHVGA